MSSERIRTELDQAVDDLELTEAFGLAVIFATIADSGQAQPRQQRVLLALAALLKERFSDEAETITDLDRRLNE
jgi:hypothetical protein